ncbi:MAG: dihydroorotase, partial [Alphaproteobacteria bacterium]
AHYGLPPNSDTLTLVREETPVTFPEKIRTGAGPVTVFDPAMPVHWRVR